MQNVAEKPVVLIVDDAPTNIHMLGEALVGECEILVSTKGTDAVAIARSESRLDLILLDVLMPDMDGYEVCSLLKGDYSTKHIPIIFVTAKTEERDETRGLALGAVDYVTKPFSMGIVRARVHTHLELKRSRDELEKLSVRDHLTGLFNRRRFDDYLMMTWRQACRSRSPLTLMMLDIDHFKRFNDTHGHLEGDECLRRVAHVIAGCAHRPMDLAVRYGGEEFALILPETERHGALAVGKRIQRRLADVKIAHGDSPVSDYVTVSIGLATVVPDEDVSVTQIVRIADSALYDAKGNGRDMIREFDSSV